MSVQKQCSSIARYINSHGKSVLLFNCCSVSFAFNIAGRELDGNLSVQGAGDYGD